MIFSVFRLAVVALLLLGWCLYHFAFKKRQLPLPPGPPKLPIIGNLHQAPTSWPWRTYQDWTKQYGPIFSVQYGIHQVIILGSHQAAHDLLNKRSNIYSSRPRSVMAGECATKGLSTLLMPYGTQWRNHQRLQASYLNVRISQLYRDLQDTESRQLIYELLSTDDFRDRYHRYSSSLIYALAYGKRMIRGDEQEIQDVDQIMENFLQAARVGTWIVDAIPLLNYLPKFMAPWKKIAADFYNFESKMNVQNLIKAQQTGSWNWSKQVLEMKEGKDMSQLELAYDVGIIYEAGSDTTTMALEIFTLAAVLYPTVMEEAQEELDRVVGTERLPGFEDRDQLPYVAAIVKEVLRWRPVSAGGIPHAVIQDDEYMGYRIPKGATVIGNHWAIHLDDAVYKDPMEFRPRRWIEEPTLPLAAFGFGRRVCTGQHIAQNSLYINIARLLWTFNIEHDEEDGSKVDPLAFSQGFNSRPLEFKARFNVRSPSKRVVVEKAYEESEKNIDAILDKIHASKNKQ